MKTLLIFFWITLSLSAYAQNGVVVQLLVSPPYSPRLADYAEGGIYYNQRLMVVRLTNTTRQPQRIMLRGEMRGRNNGVRIYTTPNYRPAAAIDLEPLQSKELNLAEENLKFLDVRNLEIAGVDARTSSQILASGILPQGLYDLCVQAYRYENERPVGQPSQGCAVLPITYIEPPRLTQPFCGRDLILRTDGPMQVVFSWNPPIGNIAGTMFTYDFYLVKVPPGQNPNDAINNAEVRRVGNPFVERDLASPFFTYGVAEPPLTDGLYAWRVIARDPDRRVVFQNDGRSEFCTFTVKTGILTDLGKAVGTEIVKTQQPPKTVVTKRIPATLALAKVANPGISSCQDVSPPTDRQAVQGNYVGQTVKIGRFDLTIDDATFQNDTYAGKGRVRWNGVPVRVAFEGVQVNAAKEVIAGWASGLNEAFRMPDVNLGSLDLMEMGKLDDNAVKTYVQNLKNNLFDQAKASVAVPLPLGYDMGSGLMGINYMRFTPTGADMGVLVNMELPEGNTYLALAGADICMAPDRVIPKNATLFLLKDLKVPFTPLTFRKSNYPNPDGTYAILKPDRELDKVHGVLDVNLGSGFLKLDDGSGKPKPGDVVASLTVDFTKWVDWVADVTLPDFTLDALAGFSFKGVKTYYDHSDLRNPAGFGVPDEFTGDKGPTFQGLYFDQLQVLMPQGFIGTGGSRFGFAARQALFAGGQFTGRITPAEKPLLDFNTGSLGTWGFSIDEFEVLLVQNRFERGGMNGKLQFPISDDYFTYSCNLRNNFDNLQFVVQPKEGGYTVPLWAARMSLYDNSNFLLSRTEGKTTVDLQLNGAVLINAPKPVSLVLPNLFFENLVVSNQPGRGGNVGGLGVYLNPGNWQLVGGLFQGNPPQQPQPRNGRGPADPFSFGNEPVWTEPLANAEGGLLGFPLSLENVGFVTKDGAIGLSLTTKLHLGDIAQAKGTVDVLGTLSLDNRGRPKPAFKKVLPSSFALNGDFGPAKASVTIDYYEENDVYGTGFKGTGKVTMPSLAAVDATVQFGKKDGFFYAYADASVTWPVGPLIAPPAPLSLNGFGGGLYVNMKMDRERPLGSITASTAGNNRQAGTTNSGIRYVPQRGGWGMKARVYIGLTDVHAMISSLELSAEFQNGGLHSIGLTGQAAILNKEGKLEGPALIKATSEMRYTVPTKTFDFNGSFKTEALTQSVDVTLNMHFSPDTWYVMAGDPNGKRIEVNLLKFGNPDKDILYANLGMNGYVALGNALPGMPRLPPDVERTLGIDEYAAKSDDRGGVYSQVSQQSSEPAADFKKQSFKVLAGASAFGSFGASIMPIAVWAKAQVGFDIAIEQDVLCRENGGKPAGIAGYYGQGQLYAFFAGGIDVFVDVWFYEGRVNLATLSAGALLRGGVLNPTWMEGKVRVRGSALGDLVSFNTGIDVAIGDKCTPAYDGDPLKDIEIITELRPTGNRVETDAALAAVFNVAIDSDFLIRLPADEVRTYRFRLEGLTSLGYLYEYYQRSQKRWVTADPFFEPEWSNGNTAMVLRNSGHLEGETDHRFTVQVRAYEVINGVEQDPRGKGGQKAPVFQKKEITFRTLLQPDVIRRKDIAYSYPIDGQLYFLKNQVPQGLIVGQIGNNMFEKGTDYRYEAFFVPEAGGEALKTPLNFIRGNRTNYSRVTFDLPPGLKNETTYRLELRRTNLGRLLKPALLLSKNEQPDRTLTFIKTTPTVVNGQTVQQQSTGQLAYSAMTRNSGDALLKSLAANHRLYQMLFRTSRFNTFGEKMAGVRLTTSGYLNGNNPTTSNYLAFDLKPESATLEDFENAELFKADYQREAGAGHRKAINYFAPLRITTPYDRLPYDTYCANLTAAPLVRLVAGGASVSYQYLSERAGGLLIFPLSAGYPQRSPIRLGKRLTNGFFGSNQPRLAVIGNPIKDQINQPILTSMPYMTGEQEPTLNARAARTYQFRNIRDHIAYYDWAGIQAFGSTLYRWRQALRTTSWNNPANVWMGLTTVDASSRSLTLRANWRTLFTRLPNDVIDSYRPQPLFGSPFQTRENARYGQGYVNLIYQPYPGAPRQEVRKEFVFPIPLTNNYTPRIR